MIVINSVAIYVYIHHLPCISVTDETATNKIRLVYNKSSMKPGVQRLVREMLYNRSVDRSTFDSLDLINAIFSLSILRASIV